MLIARFAALMMLAAAPALAATMNVANDGTDSPTCGGKTDPCRTLTQGIANAALGDKLLVGPGRYGDVDGNGTLGGPGEEPIPAGDNMVTIDKRLTITSRNGAGATIIDAGGAANNAVFVSDVSDLVFGKKKKGFTLTGAAEDGFTLEGTSERCRLEGNRAIDNGEDGFEFCDGDDHVVRFNEASHNGDNGISFCSSGGTGEGYLVTDNVAIGNGSEGFRGGAPGSTFKNNLSQGNRDEGFVAEFTGGSAPATFIGNVASGNLTEGFRLGNDIVFKGNIAHGNGGVGVRTEENGAAGTFTKNAMIGNGGPGLELTEPPSPLIEKNSFFGNGVDGATNCGVQNDTGVVVDVAKSYWGASTGPGADPADDTCGTDAVTTSSIAAKEIKVKVKAAQ